LSFSRPGRPVDNEFIEYFNGSFRDNCLSITKIKEEVDMKIDIKIMYAIRGLLAILCGLTILALSSPTIYPLSIIFTAYCLLEGLVTLLTGVKNVERVDPRWYLLGESAVNFSAGLSIFLFAGVLGLIFPHASSIMLLLLLSGRIILIGLIELLVGVFRKKAGAQLRVPIGLASIIFGLVMIYLYDKGILFFVLPLGIFGIVVGIFMIFISFMLQGKVKTTTSPEV
jgi:uncharacterized membrane protein HdeD (DUF308 family)